MSFLVAKDGKNTYSVLNLSKVAEIVVTNTELRIWFGFREESDINYKFPKKLKDDQVKRLAQHLARLATVNAHENLDEIVEQISKMGDS